MKLWDKGYQTQDLVEKFTVGNDRELDTVLAQYDIKGSQAHAKMLASIGIISPAEYQQVETALEQLLVEVGKPGFQIEPEFEDIHSKVEQELVNRIGDIGKKIHTGRSRNDQVLVDLHLYMKDQIILVKELVKELFEQLQQLSETHKDQLLPGYTHLQVAMPSSFGMWFGAYAEALVDDVVMLNAAQKVVDQNPLGSAAGYGSSFPLDRKQTTEMLGFSTLKYNAVAAQMSRGKTEKIVSYAMASVAGTLNKMAADICLYNSQNFGFVSFPKELTTGSSIMPHKQNPDVFELVRSKTNKIQSLTVELSLITTNMTSGYFRDYQLLKENFLPAIELLKSCIEISTYMLQHIQVQQIDVHQEKYKYMFSVENLNQMVQQGATFRDAYKQLGEEIFSGKFEPYTQVHHTHEGSIGNLCNQEIKQKFEEAYNASTKLK